MGLLLIFGYGFAAGGLCQWVCCLFFNDFAAGGLCQYRFAADFAEGFAGFAADLSLGSILIFSMSLLSFGQLVCL